MKRQIINTKIDRYHELNHSGIKLFINIENISEEIIKTAMFLCDYNKYSPQHIAEVYFLRGWIFTRAIDSEQFDILVYNVVLTVDAIAECEIIIYEECPDPVSAIMDLYHFEPPHF